MHVRVASAPSDWADGYSYNLSQLATADLNTDGNLEILGVSGPYTNSGYKIHAWDEHGNPVSGWPVMTAQLGPNYPYRPVIYKPAIGDIDGDGKPEIVASFYEGQLYYWNNDGIPSAGIKIPLDTATYVPRGCETPPILVNLDSDAELEIVLATWGYAVTNGSADSSRIKYRMHALNYNGTPAAGWSNKEITGKIYDIATGDITGAGSTAIIANQAVEGILHIWKNDGSYLLSGGPIALGEGLTTPVLGDLDKDEKLDIVIGSIIENKIYAFKYSGSNISSLWTRNLDTGYALIQNGGLSLTDIERDGKAEVFAVANNINTFSKCRIYAFTPNGENLSANWPKEIDGRNFA